MKNMRKFLGLFISLMLCFTFLSCEIGLGKAVDTEAPTVEFVTPSADAIIRETFTITGKYNDDGNVSEVSIMLKRTDINKQYGPFEATFVAESLTGTGKGTWSCTINPKDEKTKIPDGTYEAIVTVIDDVGHNNKQTRQFSIDNTPPVIFLTSPSSKISDNPTQYGALLSVKGNAADDSSLESIIFSFYEVNNDGNLGNLITTKQVDNVSTQIEIDLIKFGDEIYNKVYGNARDAGDKTFWLQLEAFDGAGNSTTNFYIQRDFEEINGFQTTTAYKLLNGKLVGGNDDLLTQLQNAKNQQTAILLNPKNNPYFEVQGYEPLPSSIGTPSFTFNDDNSSYTFMNKNKLTVNVNVGRDKKSIKPETIGVYLISCDENGKIYPEGNSKAKRVTLLAPFRDKNGIEIGNDKTNEISSVGELGFKWSSEQLDAATKENFDLGGYYLVDVVAYDTNGMGIINENKYGFKITTTSSAPTISIDELNSPEKKGSSLEIGKSEQFYIVGHISASTDIKNFKVCLNANENAISGLSFIKEEINTEKSQTQINTLLSTTPKSNWIYKNSTETKDSQQYYNFQVVIPENTSNDETFIINITTEDSNGQYAKKEIEVRNDTEAPVFGEYTITPTVDIKQGEGTYIQKVNGIISIKQLLSDNNSIDDSYYSVDNGSTWTQIGKTTKMNFEIDTTAFSDNVDKIIYLKAIDKSGNIKLLKNTQIITVTGAEQTIENPLVLKVDQSTDKPIINLTNTTTTIPITATGSSLEGITIFGTESNNLILANITDDDGIASIDVKYSKNGVNWDSLEIENISSITETNKPTSFNLRAKVPNIEGKYQIKILVKDKYADSRTDAFKDYAKNELGPFLIAVDNGAPDFEITTASGADQYKASEFVINGKLNDKNATLAAFTDENCTISAGSNVEINLGAWDAANNRYNWSATINGGTSPITKTYYLQARDEFGQKTVKAYTFSVDPVSPKFKVTSLQGEAVTDVNYGYKGETGGHTGNYVSVNKYGNTKDYFTVKGEVKDVKQNTETPSGVNGRYFYYYVGKSETTPSVTDGHYTPAIIQNGMFTTQTGWNSCTIKQTKIGENDVYVWEAPISFDSFDNNDDLTVYFSVMDNAGNYSKVADNPSSFLQIKIDEVAPTVGNATLDFNDDSIFVTGVARDGEAGIDDANIWVLRNGAKYTLATAVEKLSGEYSSAGVSWTAADGDKYNKYKLTITTSDVVSGKNEFVIVISDKAGNATESSKFTIDNEAPMITNKITGLGNVKDDEEFSFVKANFTTTADVNITDTDKNKIATVTYKDTYIDASDVEKTLTSGNALKSGTTNKIEISTTPAESYENKQVTRTITATNIFGQKTEWSYKFRFDTTNPVLSTSSVGDVSSSEVTNTWFNQNTLSLKGTYSETGSGVNKITYNLNGETGSIYTTVGTGANAGKETFDSTLSGFKEGVTANILKFTAIDKATNISSEQTYNVKVDTTPAKIVTGIAPNAAEDSAQKDLWYRLSGETAWKPYDAYILTDTTKAIELSGLYLDQNTTDATTKTYAQSGVKTIEIIVGSNKINATLSENKLSGRWTATATNVDLLSGISGTVTARIKVTDNAGNVDETSSFAFRVDTQAPTINLNSPNASALTDGINGTITISGSVTDGLSSATGVDGSINTIKLYYSIADQVAANTTAPTSESAWKQFDENDTKTCTTSSETFSVERTFSTQTKNLAVSDSKLILTTQETATIQYVWIKVIAQDVAGHTNEVTRKVKVDRDTDRPSIRFISPNKLKDEEDNLMSNSTPIWLKNTGTVIAIISDDDSDGSSIVKKLEYKKNDEVDWTEISLGSSNSFQFDVDDGDNKVYFKITDNKDTVFTSAATQSLQEMKFTDGVNEITSSAVLNMKVDKSSPKINTTNIKYDVFDSTANGGEGSYVGTFEKDSAKYSYGGTNNKVRIQIPASDQNGIKSVKATLKNSSGAILSTYNGDCDEATYNDEDEHIWTISDISFEGIEIQATIEIEVQDNAGLTSQEKIILPVDNTGPKITFSAPKLNGEVGVISSNEVTAYGTLSEICSEVKFAITTDPSDTAPKLDGSTRATVWNGYNFTQGSDLVALTTSEKNAIKVINYPVVYQNVKGTSLSWYVYFNGEEEVDAQTNSPKLENWLDEDHIGITTKEALGRQENPFDKIVDLYLWIYAKDEAGNTTYQKHPLRVDPQGGRPSVTIDYPESGAALGGTIRLSGSVEDNKEVKSVWVQIISGSHGKDINEGSKTFGTGSHHAGTGAVTSFNLKATDMTYLSDCGYDVRKITINEAESTTWATSAKTDAIAGTYGIKANLSGFTWNLKINIDQEFKPTTSPTTSINNMYIRVYALDDEGKWSYTENKYFQIDASKPVISDVMLKQYANGTSVSSILNNTATPIAQKTFVAGDYLNSKNGKWYATLKAKDDSTIGDVYYVDTEGNETKLTVNEHYVRSTTTNSDDTVYVAYPLTPTGNVCSWNFSIKVEDTNIPANEGKQDFELKYDNLNPKLRRPNSSSNYSIPATVKQSDGFYTIKSQIDESSASATQSGLKAVAFYFLRRNAVNNQVYVMDPMQVRTGNVQVKSAKILSSANAGDNVVYDSGLYWLKRTISRDENSHNTFTYTSANATDENSIHIGGLVQISGTLYTIIGKTGNKIIVDKDIPSQTTAYFALSMIVDTSVEIHSGEKNASDGYYDTWKPGDEDRMYEAIGGTTANPTWEAQISSKNILDGSVELHYVAFDKAGNYSIGIVGNKDWATYSGASGLYSTADVNEVKAKTPGVSGDYVDFVYSFDAEEPCYVKNNAPRLSMITVGCDYDGNGVIGNNENETKSYYNSKVEGKNKAGGVTDNLIVNSGTEAFMTLKDKSSITMEIIGGNGNLYYSYNIEGVSRTITGANTTTIGTGNYDSETSDYLVNEGGDDVVNVNAATHQKTIDISLDDFKNYLGKGSGTGSANTAFIDNNTPAKPYTTFTYKIWDSTDGEIVAGANALNTWSTQNAQMSVKLDVQVHDQTPPKLFMNGFTKNHFDPATGHIDLRTNLPDDTFKETTGIFDKDPKVSGKIKVTGYAYDDIRLESLWLQVTDFTFTGLADSPSTKDGSRTGFVKVATYNSASGTWTGSENTTQGWKFTVDATHEDAYQDDNGHKVIWQLELDTTKVSGVAGTDKTISLYAKDVRGVSDTLTNGLYSSNDEVAGTGVSEKEKDKDRNAPNYRVDIVPYITKLSRSNTNVETKRSKLGKYQVVIGEGLTLEGFNLPTTAANVNNGYFRATTANKNAERATVATNGTRITAASLTNTGATLTATVRSGYVVAVTNGIISLNNMNTGNECAPEDMYNDDDEWTDDVYLNCWKNDEYFYKSNDPISPAMDRIPSKKVNNAYNENVSTLYGGWATQSSKFFASYPNTTGSGSTGNAPSPASETNATSKDMVNGHHFGDPATFYDVVIDESGNRYNILLDCWQGNTTGWGRNFVINRNGYYTHDNGFGSGAPNSNTLRHVIERMGKGGTSPDNADSSDGTDELFNQFLNPRMALNNGDAYITYYDRYAKCLKWAMVAPQDYQTKITRKYATEGVWKQSSGREGDNVGNYFQETNIGTERNPDWKLEDDFGNVRNTLSNYYTNGGFIVAGYDTLQSGGSKTNLDVGRWSSIAIDTENSAPIVAYYDATHKQLWLATGNGAGSNNSENKTSYPINSNTPVLTGNATSATNGQGNAWTRQQVGDSKLRLGQYVSMVVDSSNNLHIACYGTGGGNKLYYIKGTKQASGYGNYTFTTTCVDPNGAGTWTDIKLEDGNPVISYYDPSNDSSESAIKVAYFDGAQWDHMTAPLSSSAISDRVTLALDITDGVSLSGATANNSKLAVGYVSSRFDCVYLRKE